MRYVAGVDHLRAFAAILIVLYHGQILFGAYNAGGDRVASYVHTHNPLRAVICEGHTAVGLFMVLSGFIFSFGSRNSEIEWRGFMRNRCLRILPLMVTLAVVGAYAFPNQMSLAGLAQHALLMSNLPGAAPMGPFNLMFWTIAVEFQFYLIFPFLLRFIRQGGWRYAGALIALALVMRYISVINGANPRHLSYWTIVGRIDQFVLGILLGLHYRPSISSFRARLLTLATCARDCHRHALRFSPGGRQSAGRHVEDRLADARSGRVGALYRRVSERRRCDSSPRVVESLRDRGAELFDLHDAPDRDRHADRARLAAALEPVAQYGSRRTAD